MNKKELIDLLQKYPDDFNIVIIQKHPNGQDWLIEDAKIVHLYDAGIIGIEE